MAAPNDTFLYPGESNPNDIRLRDPTVVASSGSGGKRLLTAAGKRKLKNKKRRVSNGSNNACCCGCGPCNPNGVDSYCANMPCTATVTISGWTAATCAVCSDGKNRSSVVSLNGTYDLPGGTCVYELTPALSGVSGQIKTYTFDPTCAAAPATVSGSADLRIALNGAAGAFFRRLTIALNTLPLHSLFKGDSAVSGATCVASETINNSLTGSCGAPPYDLGNGGSAAVTYH